MGTQAAHLQANRAPGQGFSSQLLIAVLLLAIFAGFSGAAALRESVCFDEAAHIGAGLSYWQRLDMRLNEEHPPLAKLLAGLPLALRHTYADYSSPAWTQNNRFFVAYMGQWIFGEYVLHYWDSPAKVLFWSRLPMLLLSVALGWLIYVYGTRLGGPWGGVLPVVAYTTAPVFLTFAPLVLTDVAITLFSLWALWRFAELWRDPTSGNMRWFAVALATALLSKFSAILLFFAFLAFSLSTRWIPLPGQPAEKQEARLWRRARWRITLKGVLWAFLIVYVVYFIFSWHETNQVLYLLGHGPVTAPIRRLLMPIWLYVRGMLLVFATGNRPAFILGHTYPHGTWLYFPVLLVLKSPVGFLALLLLAGLVALRTRRIQPSSESLIAAGLRFHWRMTWISLVVLGGLCILSHLNVSFRHFMLPLVLLMLMLAPLPPMLQRLRASSSAVWGAATGLVVLCALSMLLVPILHYPYYMPYVNALSFGRPLYTLMSDSNVDWNQSLPDVERFAEQHGEKHLKIDEYAITESSAVVPGSELWDCQLPTAEDSGQWVVVSANVLIDMHNCSWLLQYPHEVLAAGSMYAVQLPQQIPAAGTPGGPPAANKIRTMFGFPRDPRIIFQYLMHHPDQMEQTAMTVGEELRKQAEERKRKK